MQDETGLALYLKAGELGMPVGVMCFKGFGLHVKDIEALLQSSPQTKVRYSSITVYCTSIYSYILLCMQYSSMYICRSIVLAVIST